MEIINQGIDMARLQMHPQNYNQHPERQIKQLRESLRRFGQVRSIVVQAVGDAEFDVVAGNGILMAARQEGLTELRCDVLPSGWEPHMVAAYLVADNELGKHASPDQAQLAKILKSVAIVDDSLLAAMGVRDADLLMAGIDGKKDAESQISRADELQEIWKVELGQMWRLPSRTEGREHRLICGDCTDRDVVDRVMSDGKPVVIFTDPPYGVSIAKKNVLLNSFDKGGRNLTDIVSDDLLPQELKAMLLPAFALAREKWQTIVLCLLHPHKVAS